RTDARLPSAKDRAGASDVSAVPNGGAVCHDRCNLRVLVALSSHRRAAAVRGGLATLRPKPVLQACKATSRKPTLLQSRSVSYLQDLLGGLFVPSLAVAGHECALGLLGVVQHPLEIVRGVLNHLHEKPATMAILLIKRVA